MNIYSKQSGTVTQLFGLAEDHVRLALLEAAHERHSLQRALVYLALAGCALVSAVVLLHVAILGGFMALGWAAWQAALGLAAAEVVICVVAWFLFRRNAWRPDMFQGTRNEFQRTIQWIHQHLN